MRQKLATLLAAAIVILVVLVSAGLALILSRGGTF